jgi:hypothetical protein
LSPPRGFHGQIPYPKSKGCIDKKRWLSTTLDSCLLLPGITDPRKGREKITIGKYNVSHVSYIFYFAPWPVSIDRPNIFMTRQHPRNVQVPEVKNKTFFFY